MIAKFSIFFKSKQTPLSLSLWEIWILIFQKTLFHPRHQKFYIFRTLETDSGTTRERESRRVDGDEDIKIKKLKSARSSLSLDNVWVALQRHDKLLLWKRDKLQGMLLDSLRVMISEAWWAALRLMIFSQLWCNLGTFLLVAELRLDQAWTI